MPDKKDALPARMPLIKARGTVRIIDKDGNVKANLSVRELPVETQEEKKDATS